jgi:hypothetical protein
LQHLIDQADKGPQLVLAADRRAEGRNAGVALGF